MRVMTLVALTGLTLLGLSACKDDPATPPVDTDVPTPTPPTPDDTFDTSGGPELFGAYVGVATVDPATSAYTGYEDFRVFDAAADPRDLSAVVCSMSWDAAGAPLEATDPVCEGCVFSLNVTLNNGAENGTAGACAAFEVEPADADGDTYGYGYDDDFVYDGETLQVMMFINGDGDWVPVTIDVTFDGTTFDYVW